MEQIDLSLEVDRLHLCVNFQSSRKDETLRTSGLQQAAPILPPLRHEVTVKRPQILPPLIPVKISEQERFDDAARSIKFWRVKELTISSSLLAW